MKRIIKKYRMLWKQSLLNKLIEQKKLNKYYKTKLDEYIVTDRKYIDELNKKQRIIRDLELKVKKYENKSIKL